MIVATHTNSVLGTKTTAIARKICANLHRVLAYMCIHVIAGRSFHLENLITKKQIVSSIPLRYAGVENNAC